MVPAPYAALVAEALAAWKGVAGIRDGYLFRRVRRGGHVTDEKLTPHAVGAIVKRRAAEAGLEVSDLGSHSLRSGRLTEEAGRGASPWELMRISRHRSIRTLQDYIRLEEA
jgi:integrase